MSQTSLTQYNQILSNKIHCAQGTTSKAQILPPFGWMLQGTKTKHKCAHANQSGSFTTKKTPSIELHLVKNYNLGLGQTFDHGN